MSVGPGSTGCPAGSSGTAAATRPEPAKERRNPWELDGKTGTWMGNLWKIYGKSEIYGKSMANGFLLGHVCFFGHLFVLTGHKWDYRSYKWGDLVLITGKGPQLYGFLEDILGEHPRIRELLRKNIIYIYT